MNPISQLPPHSSFSCDRHPNENFNGFCPSCLCERLTTLDTTTSSSNTPSSSRRPSSASAAIKSLFTSKPSKPSSFFPELRRSKSFSASKNEALGAFFEPKRKSCDVKVRSTLPLLFKDTGSSKIVGANCNGSRIVDQNDVKIESLVSKKPVFEEFESEGEEEEEEFRDAEDLEEGFDDGGDEIRPVGDGGFVGFSNVVDNNSKVEFFVEKEEEEGGGGLKRIKDHIDIDTQEKKGGGGGFWAAASVFSKKWQKWRKKHKVKKGDNGENLATLPVEKPISRQFRETQSEIADYGYGRRSCDVDPRFSLDVGRVSFDDARYSFDEPRASWDGHLVGRSFPRMAPMVSVMEDVPGVSVVRPDMQIPVAEEDEGVPGGSIQTRDYYLDSSSSRRRKSLDRSSSIRKTAAAVVAEIDELKTNASNGSKVSPDYFHGAKVTVGRERDFSNSNSLRDDCSETFELGSGFRDRDSLNSVIGNNNGESNKESKKSKRWSWRIWGFINRRNKDEDDHDEKFSRVSGVERSLSESWNGDVRGGINRNMFRSNSSVSWRNGTTSIGGGSFGSVRKSNVEMNGSGNGKKKKNEFVLEKNRSARYSPKETDNGLLRFYLTPLAGSRRGGEALSKIKPNNSHSIARSVLRLY